jgi:hypothetical protein
LTVPVGAVYKTPEGADFVLLAGADGKAHQTKVKIGIRNKELAEIETGVKEKDPVITAGGYALPDGTKIKVEEAPPAEAEGGKEGEAGKDAGDAAVMPDSGSEKEKAPVDKPAAGKAAPASKPPSKPAAPKDKE